MKNWFKAREGNREMSGGWGRTEVRQEITLAYVG